MTSAAHHVMNTIASQFFVVFILNQFKYGKYQILFILDQTLA